MVADVNSLKCTNPIIIINLADRSTDDEPLISLSRTKRAISINDANIILYYSTMFEWFAARVY